GGHEADVARMDLLQLGKHLADVVVIDRRNGSSRILVGQRGRNVLPAFGLAGAARNGDHVIGLGGETRGTAAGGEQNKRQDQLADHRKNSLKERKFGPNVSRGRCTYLTEEGTFCYSQP